MPLSPRLKPPPKPLPESQLREPLFELYEEHRLAGTLPTSARFLFYELVTRKWISKESLRAIEGKKGRRPDQNMLDALTWLREQGRIPWQYIIDETRALDDFTGTTENILDWTLEALDAYKLDPWRGDSPVVLTESRSLAGVLRPIAYEYRVKIASTNGQCAGFLHTTVAPALGPSRHVLYFGDADFGGGHIQANTRSVLEQERGALDWEYLAVTEEQVREYDLPVMLKYDKRDKQKHEAVETEALGQTVITRILRERLAALLGESLEDVQEREANTRRKFREWLEANRGTWKD
jgi:hypothetical protein